MAEKKKNVSDKKTYFVKTMQAFQKLEMLSFVYLYEILNQRENIKLMNACFSSFK